MSQLHKSLYRFLNITNKTQRVSNVIVRKRNVTTAASVQRPSALKWSAVGIGVGALVGVGYSIYHLNTPRAHIMNYETTIPIINDVPSIEPSRKVRYVSNQSDLKLTLYQYQTCPFCCKVRAFLDYFGISYDVIEVDPVLRQSIKWSPYKKVPILLAEVKDGYQPLNDSSMIVSALSTYLTESYANLTDVVSYYPILRYIDEGGVEKKDVMNKYFLMHGDKTPRNTKEELMEERKWRQWVDDVLVHTLSPNVYRTREEAFQAFNWFSHVGDWETHFPTWERYLIIYAGAFAMWMIGKRLKKRHNLKDDVRQSLYDECDKFVRAVRHKGTPFIGGDRPNLADLAVYGVLNSIEGCDAFQDALNYSNIKSWYFLMKDAVQSHKGSLSSK